MAIIHNHPSTQTLFIEDIGFTPGKVEELPINFRVENTVNKDEINEQSLKNRQMGEELLRQFEERQKAEVVGA